MRGACVLLLLARFECCGSLGAAMQAAALSSAPPWLRAPSQPAVTAALSSAPPWLRAPSAPEPAAGIEPAGAKVYTTSVALVPPDDAWLEFQEARESLRDAGLYRWPPHVNLLYPFVPEADFGAATTALSAAAASIVPFEVLFDGLGVFGGRHRGTLYCHPVSAAQVQSLVYLQAALQSCIPHCDDQQRGGKFVPHLTLAHFPSAESAAEARNALLERGWAPRAFTVKADVHVMRRIGAGGQFERCAMLPLGGPPHQTFAPPMRFDKMPLKEAAYVSDARAAKKRQPYKPSRQRSPRRSPEERAQVKMRTLEDIAEIRAARAAKKQAAESQASESPAALSESEPTEGQTSLVESRGD
ncbi:2'-5' RNA ligase superfamily-domain-containing protein [Pelagophyceae sp. CCMP2097]|nr:2'-5' RNA ligase superfamily-domain-containing protein [Pelagophyceae sp. CCMP2097]